MSDKLEIRITGNNQSSAAFQQVTRDAQAMGTSVEQAGQRGGRSLAEMSRHMAAAGAAAGTLVVGMSIAGRSFASQEQQLRGLQRAYGDSTDDIERFADELQRSTVYSDDSARQ